MTNSIATCSAGDSSWKEYVVVSASSGAEALELLSGMQFDVVPLDVKMPVQGGCEVLAEIRNSWSSLELPVLMVTANNASWIALLVWKIEAPKTFGNVLSAVVSVGGILAGFLATARSVLMTIQGARIVSDLRRTGYYVLILGYLRSATLWSCLLAVYSCILLFVDWTQSGSGDRIPWFAAWIGTAVTAALAYFRVMRIYGSLFRPLHGA